jgi:hypothetical protein
VEGSCEHGNEDSGSMKLVIILHVKKCCLSVSSIQLLLCMSNLQQRENAVAYSHSLITLHSPKLAPYCVSQTAALPWGEGLATPYHKIAAILLNVARDHGLQTFTGTDISGTWDGTIGQRINFSFVCGLCNDAVNSADYKCRMLGG